MNVSIENMFFKNKGHKERYRRYWGLITDNKYFFHSWLNSPIYVLAAISFSHQEEIEEHIEACVIDFKPLLKRSEKWWCDGEIAMVKIAANNYNDKWKADIASSFLNLDMGNRITVIESLKMLYVYKTITEEFSPVIKRYENLFEGGMVVNPNCIF